MSFDEFFSDFMPKRCITSAKEIVCAKMLWKKNSGKKTTQKEIDMLLSEIENGSNTEVSYSDFQDAVNEVLKKPFDRLQKWTDHGLTLKFDAQNKHPVSKKMFNTVLDDVLSVCGFYPNLKISGVVHGTQIEMPVMAFLHENQTIDLIRYVPALFGGEGVDYFYSHLISFGFPIEHVEASLLGKINIEFSVACEIIEQTCYRVNNLIVLYKYKTFMLSPKKWEVKMLFKYKNFVAKSYLI